MFRQIIGATYQAQRSGLYATASRLYCSATSNRLPTCWFRALSNRQKKRADGEPWPINCEGINLQRGTAETTELGGKPSCCISCGHHAPFLIGWKTFFVQCSYATADHPAEVVRGGWHLEGSHRDLLNSLEGVHLAPTRPQRNELFNGEEAMCEEAMPLIGFDDFADLCSKCHKTPSQLGRELIKTQP